MDSPVLFCATSQVTAPFARAVPGPALLPPDGKGREETPSEASESVPRPWDALVAAGTQGHRASGTWGLRDTEAQLLLTPVATQDNTRSCSGAGNPALD